MKVLKNVIACFFCVSGLYVFGHAAFAYAQEASAPSSSVALTVGLGVEEDGTVTPEWKKALRIWHDEDTLPGVLDDAHSLSHDETLWIDLIRHKILTWSGATDSLAIPFRGITPPDTVYILVGNVGGQDAFTYSDSTIGFDVNRLYHLYGAASTSENSNRIDRFFAHEYTHILHKAWRNAHGLEFESPFEFALWECLTEGLGNYRSLSSKWIVDGALTAHAAEVLARLQPVFAERLAALKHADDEEAVALLDGLSSGPFDQKWGALTVALWLAQEAGEGDHRLQRWVDAGPWGVLTLAGMYLPEDLKSTMPQRGE